MRRELRRKATARLPAFSSVIATAIGPAEGADPVGRSGGGKVVDQAARDGGGGGQRPRRWSGRSPDAGRSSRSSGR